MEGKTSAIPRLCARNPLQSGGGTRPGWFFDRAGMRTLRGSRSADNMTSMHPTRTRSGFTLIELLTVIAIIAILMGLLLPALNSAKNAARKSQAKSDLTQFVTAVKAFYTDYGTYPIDPGLGVASDEEYGSSSGVSKHNQDVVNVLRADTSTSDTLTSGTTPLGVNTRAVVYLDVPLVKDNSNPKSGIGTTSTQGPYANSKGGDWYDPWGVPYIIAIDGNYNGYIDSTCNGVLLKYTGGVNYVQLTNSGSGGGTGAALQTGCVAASFGADKTQGSSSSPMSLNGADDVVSWQ